MTAVERLEIESASEEQTQAVGRALGRTAQGGEVLALVGELGAGKTVLVRALARGLGVPEDEPVTSPTYVLVAEYSARARLIHIDAYRLAGEEEFNGLGAMPEPHDAAGCLVAIEWADRVVGAVPRDRLTVTIEHRAQDRRALSIHAEGGHARAWLARARDEIAAENIEQE